MSKKELMTYILATAIFNTNIAYSLTIGANVGANQSNFTNNQTITASKIVGDNTNAEARGVNVERNLNLDISIDLGPSSQISAESQSGNGLSYSFATGIYVNGPRNVSTFNNQGSILSIARKSFAPGQGSVYSRGLLILNGNINTFRNSRSINAKVEVGDVSGQIRALSSGLEVYGTINDFENSGSITATTTAGNFSGSGSGGTLYSYGVISRYVTTFRNLGNINSQINTGDITSSSRLQTRSYGLLTANINNSFTNSGNIISTISSGNTTNASIRDIEAYGIYVWNNVNSDFNNSGVISATATTGNVEGNSDVSITSVGINPENINGPFKNEGEISANTTTGSISSSKANVSSYGIQVLRSTRLGRFGDVNNDFINLGNIKANASVVEVKDGAQDVYINASGVQVYNNVTGTFQNSGNIHTTFSVGNVYNGGVVNRIDGNAVEINGSANNFINSGILKVEGFTGNVDGQGSKIQLFEPIAVVINGLKGTFDNQGTIESNANAGSATNGGTLNLQASGAYISDAQNGSAINSNDIKVNVKAGSGVDINNVSGVRLLSVNNTSNLTFTNNGNMYINIDAPNANTVSASGIYVYGAPNYPNTVTISNPGAIYLTNNHPNADIRTLRIEGNSNVTLNGDFSIVFGQKFVDVDDQGNPHKRPIYVGNGSTLNLNNATLVVKIGNSNLLKINTPYYLIENHGVVNGEFALNLKLGYSNQDFNLIAEWYDPNQRGQNAAIIFKVAYTPQNSPTILGVYNSIATSGLMVDELTRSLWLEDRFIAKSNKRYFASIGDTRATDFSRSSNDLKDRIYVKPFYTRLKGGDLRYNSETYGGALGYERYLTKDTRFGIFGGYAKSDVDFKIPGAENEKQDIFIGGVYLDKLPEKRPYYVLAGLVGYVANHDYRGRTGFNFDLREKGKYDSYGLMGRLRVGYQIKGDDWEVVPMLGLGVNYYSYNGFTTKADNPSFNRKVKSDDGVYGLGYVGVAGTKAWVKENRRYYVEGDMGIEQVFGSNDIQVKQAVPGVAEQVAIVKQKISNTSFVGKLGVGVEIGERYEIKALGTVKLNSDYSSYGGQLILSYRF